MDLDTLALAVDEQVRTSASDRGSGRLYAVRLGPGGPTLELLLEGEARRLPQRVYLPAGLAAVALASGAWAAPMADDGFNCRPSQHAERRRVHLTTLVATEGPHDAVEVSVLRYGNGAPTVLRGGIGVIHDRMLRCWSRRPEAQRVGSRSNPAA
jgi:hypothetical protein